MGARAFEEDCTVNKTSEMEREQERPGFGLDARILDGTQGERRGVDEVRDTKEDTGDVKTRT